MTITIKKGRTFRRVLRPTAEPFIYKSITAIAQTAPVRITAAAHGLMSGQYVAVVCVKGMKEINVEVDAKGYPKAYYKATVIDPDTIEINLINASNYSAYTSGGQLQFLTPVDMTGCTVRRSIKTKLGGVELLRLDTVNGGLTIDNANGTISELIPASVTAGLTFKKGVTDLELVRQYSYNVVDPVTGIATTMVGEEITEIGDPNEPEDVIVLDEVTT